MIQAGQRTEKATPLAGKRVLVTRARVQAGPLSKLLRAAGAVPVECPAISIAPAHDYTALDAALRALDRYHWMIFTSANAVTHVEQRLQGIGASWRALDGLSVAAIGPKTAHELQARGVTVVYIPTEYVSAAIAAGLPLRPGQRVLLARADIADKRLVYGLRERGATVDEFVAYRTLPPEVDMEPLRAALATDALAAVTLASSSTVRNLITALGTEASALLAGTVIACIGPVTAQTARECGLEPRIVAAEHTIEGLVAALEEYFRATDTAH